METLAQAGGLGGSRAHPLSLYLPSRTKLQCTRQLRGGDGSQSTYFPRDETGLVCLPIQLERTHATLLVMVNVMRGGGRAPPTLTSQGQF
jgi:hypothetical protein